jgi:hypothetical protein
LLAAKILDGTRSLCTASKRRRDASLGVIALAPERDGIAKATLRTRLAGRLLVGGEWHSSIAK